MRFNLSLNGGGQWPDGVKMQSNLAGQQRRFARKRAGCSAKRRGAGIFAAAAQFRRWHGSGLNYKTALHEQDFTG
jgi:hypothetical protein